MFINRGVNIDVTPSWKLNIRCCYAAALLTQLFNMQFLLGANQLNPLLNDRNLPVLLVSWLKQGGSHVATSTQNSSQSSGKTLEVPWPWPKPSQIPRMLSASEAEHLHLTQPTKLLSCMSVGSTRQVKESGHEPAFLAAKLGVFRSPDEFVDLACNLQHPFDNSSGVSDDLKRNLFFLLTAGPAAVQDKREPSARTLQKT